MRASIAIACLLPVWIFAVPVAIRATPDEPTSTPTLSSVDYNREILPILARQCYQCHGPDEKTRKANLRLDVRDEAIKAGAFVPGNPDKSEVIARIGSADAELRMPPVSSKKPALTPKQIAIFRRWISEGAKFSEHWSFTPLGRPVVPAIPNSPTELRNPIDNFILARLKIEGVAPSPEADRVTLIRRLYFDLTGLPPLPEEVRAFVEEKSTGAYEKVVDKLLASPHYGERMAIWWLDLVRYADSMGYHGDNPMNVYPYRDYVITVFNENKPFDQFTIEQLAGDLLPKTTTKQKIATAYNRLILTTEEGGAQAREYEAKYSADRVRNFGQVWLGGTLMCAECHDHKFDPYTQADFYSMAAFFADIQEAAVGAREPGLSLPGTPEQVERVNRLTRNFIFAQAKLEAAAHLIVTDAYALAEVEKWPLPAPASGELAAEFPTDVRAILATRSDLRTPAYLTRLTEFVRDTAPDLQPDRDALAAATKAKDDFENSLPRVLVTNSGPARTVRILARGNWLDESGPVVSPKTPAFLPPLPALAAGASRYTRLDLARWTVSPENPLTARVAVNRLWKLFYGYGLARSLEESGTQGQLPTHPELLDWLASEFQSKWDVKQMVKLMVTSATYRQSSVETPAVRERDPMNKLLARQSRYRLDAEFVRDTALSISGLLNPAIGGPSVKPFQPAGYWAVLSFPEREWEKDTGEKVYRRGMYTHWQRTFPHPAMIAFDAPSREECTCERPKSNVPQQALVLLNDPEFVEAARAFAQKTLSAGGVSDMTKLNWAFERATARKPKKEEIAVLNELLDKHRKLFIAKPDDAKKLLAVGDLSGPKDLAPAELAAWISVCRVILNLHETITRQ
ncbi:MAG TPA: PSD1 and planctomycete cytochrome C domain-containing protein [Gemmata sp.]|nr:PSD1 and planctomycete cytochrome C domain-containing protein [Gemmata sp.]